MCTLSNSTLPIVYTCAGASNLAQLANDIGLWLHQQRHARMSALAGLAGRDPEHIEELKSAQAIVAIDGCAKECVKRCLANFQVSPRWHINLETTGIRKCDEAVCSLQDTFKAMRHVSEQMNIQIDTHFSDHLNAPR